MFEHITASEIAGFGVGAFLLGATVYAPKIDSFISVSQRRKEFKFKHNHVAYKLIARKSRGENCSLGMCKRCGDLRLIACSSCKGSGVIKGGPFNFIQLENKSKIGSSSCTKCRARGHFQCPECSNKLSQA